jgi:(2S)-methylsuccinyl-CoA dehydrogenase
MVLARTGGPGHKGLSAFAVEKPAYEGHAFDYTQEGGGRLTGRAIPTIGYRGMHTYELSFERFHLSKDALIGGQEWLDRGFYLQMEGFALGRIQTAGRAVGLMQAAFEDTVAYTKERHVFGRPIFANELSRAKIGEMALRLQASRQLSYRAAEMLDRGDGQRHASLAKLYASRMAEAVARDASQLHGAMGYSEETDVSRYFVDARVLPVFEGAEEVLSLRVIGPALLRNA